MKVHDEGHTLLNLLVLCSVWTAYGRVNWINKNELVENIEGHTALESLGLMQCLDCIRMRKLDQQK